MAFAASGGSADLTYVVESTYGQTPATPAMLYLPINSTTLGLTREQLQSARLRADRQIEHVRFGNKSVAGDIDFELSPTDFDSIFAAVLFAPWTANVLTGVGTTPTTMTLERRHLDIDQFFVYRGAAVNTLSLTIQPGAIVSGTIGIMARDAERVAVSLGTPAAMTSREPYDSFTGSMTFNGAPLVDVTSIELTIDNSLEQNWVLFDDRSREYTARRCNVTGTLVVPFTEATAAFYDMLTDDIETSLAFTIGGNGSGMTFELPRIKITASDVPVPDDGALSLTLPFQCLLDSTAGTGTNIRITRNV